MSSRNSNNNDDIKIVYDFPSKGAGEIVNRVMDRLNECFKKTFPNLIVESTSKSRYVLTVTLLQCTEGSRWGRICCGELGVGWVVLEIQWKLTDTVTSIVLTKGTKKLRDSGAIGFVDMCKSDMGEVALLDEMTPKLANKIALASLNALQQPDKSNLETATEEVEPEEVETASKSS